MAQRFPGEPDRPCLWPPRALSQHLPHEVMFSQGDSGNTGLAVREGFLEEEALKCRLKDESWLGGKGVRQTGVHTFILSPQASSLLALGYLRPQSPTPCP